MEIRYCGLIPDVLIEFTRSHIHSFETFIKGFSHISCNKFFFWQFELKFICIYLFRYSLFLNTYIRVVLKQLPFFFRSSCIIYSLKKIFAKATAEQKIFRGRSKALKISILFKMMNFIHCYNCILYFDCSWKQVQNTKCLYKYLKLAQ